VFGEHNGFVSSFFIFPLRSLRYTKDGEAGATRLISYACVQWPEPMYIEVSEIIDQITRGASKESCDHWLLRSIIYGTCQVILLLPTQFKVDAVAGEYSPHTKLY